MEIFWTFGNNLENWKNCKLGNFLEILEKLEKFVDLEKKLGNSGEKLDIWEKNGNLEKIVDLEFFKMSKNLEILKKFGKSLVKIWKFWKFGKNKIGNLRKEIKKKTPKIWKNL